MLVYPSTGVIVVSVVIRLSLPAQFNLAKLSPERSDLPSSSVVGCGEDCGDVVYTLELLEDADELSF